MWRALCRRRRSIGRAFIFIFPKCSLFVVVAAARGTAVDWSRAPVECDDSRADYCQVEWSILWCALRFCNFFFFFFFFWHYIYRRVYIATACTVSICINKRNKSGSRAFGLDAVYMKVAVMMASAQGQLLRGNRNGRREERKRRHIKYRRERRLEGIEKRLRWTSEGKAYLAAKWSTEKAGCITNIIAKKEGIVSNIKKEEEEEEGDWCSSCRRNQQNLLPLVCRRRPLSLISRCNNVSWDWTETATGLVH